MGYLIAFGLGFILGGFLMSALTDKVVVNINKVEENEK